MSQPLLSPPQRPLPIRALNRVGGWLVRGGLVSGRLEVDGLLAHRDDAALRVARPGPGESLTPVVGGRRSVSAAPGQTLGRGLSDAR
jgi:hypothetical protein